MPVLEKLPDRSGEHDTLVGELLAEWTHPQSINAEPVIIVERGRDHLPAHVYVIWSRWAGVDRVERSEIIMDAAEKIFPMNEVLNISIAMGLTPDEATRLGMKF